ncbi:hypothetical protein [Variovorax sp. V15]|uniref:hypothetical protein n=1 Tax=Variovorax sp. V15 TaxID=3065952 RepID=UPI0034E87231
MPSSFKPCAGILAAALLAGCGSGGGITQAFAPVTAPASVPAPAAAPAPAAPVIAPVVPFAPGVFKGPGATGTAFKVMAARPAGWPIRRIAMRPIAMRRLRCCWCPGPTCRVR